MTTAVPIEFECPECKTKLPSNKELGKHRYMKHGVRGTSKAALRRYELKAHKPKAKKGRFICDLCKEKFPRAVDLGKHKFYAHCIPGQSKTAIKMREKVAEAFATYQCEVCEYKTTKPRGINMHRSFAHHLKPRPKAELISPQPPKEIIERGNAEAEGTTRINTLEKVQSHSNGQAPHPNGDIPEATLAVAFGRFSELCRSIAFEYDLPPRLFTTRLSELIFASQVRQPSRRAV